MSSRIPVIIDTDPGVDDAIAIMIAAASERLDILGLTPVDGNVSSSYTFYNALALRDWLGLSCPVAKGASEQIGRRLPRSSSAHGVTGLGSVTLPKPTGTYDARPAWDFIYETAKKLGGELRIIAIGPLTNLAKMFTMYPDAAQYIKQIAIMGGSTSDGNVTPYAEFNFWADGEAARIVFESGVPIAMAGLNVTHPTGISLRYIDEIANDDTFFSKAMKAFVTSYADVRPNKENEASSIVHDAIPVTWFADPVACTFERCRIDIMTDEEHYGQSVRSDADKTRFNCDVITDVDMRRYEALYKKMADKFRNTLIG